MIFDLKKKGKKRKEIDRFGGDIFCSVSELTFLLRTNRNGGDFFVVLGLKYQKLQLFHFFCFLKKYIIFL